MSDLPMIVKVKPLVWKWSGQVDGWRADCELTRDVFITYQSLEKWAACSQVFRFTYHQTAEDAKAHLDQMRASRIIATIEAVPVSEVMTLAALAAARRTGRIIEDRTTLPVPGWRWMPEQENKDE